ncbi:MAG TPA: DUF4037 domain-containing protein [Ktedonobacteraceae bacterium]|nr:DUF4037 domain-containing protein [Ktedonobacteraceae bacterium]
MPEFIPGRELSRRLYEEAVHPLLEQHFPHLPYAAAHLGNGSDVLGFDTEMSRDHGWGPSLLLFLREEDAHLAESIRGMLAYNLPRQFYGYPLNFFESAQPGTFGMQHTDEGPINHHVFPTTVRAFFQYHLGYDISRPPDVAEWLTFTSEELREVTTGAVHHDGTGELTAVRNRLSWYPHDIWLYLLACGWKRIGEEEHLMPRAGFVGDELGSAIIGSRLVRDIMNLCFLMEKQYAPYPKWLGTAFKRLSCAGQLWPALWRAQQGATWQEREAALSEAYASLARMHNALGITQKLPESVSQFFDRPFKVIKGEQFAQALIAQISDPTVQSIASRRLIGSIDQFSDSTDLRVVKDWRPILRALYHEF